MDLVKLWPIIAGVIAVLIALIKLLFQVQKSLDWQREVAPRFVAVEANVAHLQGLPERMKDLEKKIERMTPRVREVQRLRTDLDALDDDVSEVREAMLTRRALGPRSRRSRTPPAGVPTLLPGETTESNEDDSGGHST